MLAEKLSLKSRNERFFHTEDRCRFMEEILAGIQVYLVFVVKFSNDFISSLLIERTLKYAA